MVQARKPTEVNIRINRGETTKSYKTGDERTGAKEYGKESKTKPTPSFVKEAQAKGREIVTKNGLRYRAGYRTDTKKPDTTNTTIKVTPEIKTVPMKKQVPVYTDDRAKSAKNPKLKAKAMTYGTDDPKKGGGTKYKARVRAR